MNLAQTNQSSKTARLDSGFVARQVAYTVAALAFLNALYFVLRGTNPAMRDDDWYFLDVFLRKAIDGTLGFADLFVKRMGPDHAQPLFKLVLLGEWHYLGLDLSLGAVLGVFAAAGCALVYFRLVASGHGRRVDSVSLLAWTTICALLFSLNGNSASQWTWPLNALLNITNLIMLLFLLAIWRALETRRYTLLIVATLFLGFSSDDQAIIAAIAAVLTLLLMQWVNREQRNKAFWKVPLAIGLCMVVVRVAYLFFPVVGGGLPGQSLHTLGLLVDRFSDQGWWMWTVYPLTVPVSEESPFRFLGATAWLTIVVVIALILFIAHIWFWREAFRCRYNRTIFVAVATMLIIYGYVAGIILFRVGYFGNVDVRAPRYIVLYTGHLIALLLMWAATRENAPQSSSIRSRALAQFALIAGCLVLLLVQIPLSIQAWRTLPYLHIAYANMASQIEALTAHPERQMKCAPELPVCNFPEDKRAELTVLLGRNELNVFSPWVQRLHPYLPKLSPVTTDSSDGVGRQSGR